MTKFWIKLNYFWVKSDQEKQDLGELMQNLGKEFDDDVQAQDMEFKDKKNFKDNNK